MLAGSFRRGENTYISGSIAGIIGFTFNSNAAINIGLIKS
jgi:hypothetical protein